GLAPPALKDTNAGELAKRGTAGTRDGGRERPFGCLEVVLLRLSNAFGNLQLAWRRRRGYRRGRRCRCRWFVAGRRGHHEHPAARCRPALVELRRARDAERRPRGIVEHHAI